MKLLKRLICLTLAVLMLGSLCACGGTNGNTPETTEGTTAPVVKQPADTTTPVSDGKTLKMLCLTSSFGVDTTELLAKIAYAEGATDVVIGRLYASGCTLEKHVQNTMSTNGLYDNYYKSTPTGDWTTTPGVPLLPVLKEEDWDIIYIQQGAAAAALPHTYGDYLNQLIDFIDKNKTNPNARYVWNLTWAYQGDSTQSVFTGTFASDQMAMYDALISTVQEQILTRTDFSAVIPTGTAVQNARTSYFGDNLCKDTYHLNNLGKVIAAYTAWSKLTGQTITEVKLQNPISTRDLPSPVAMLTEDDKKVIVEAVNNAIANPYEITQSQYTQKP